MAALSQAVNKSSAAQAVNDQRMQPLKGEEGVSKLAEELEHFLPMDLPNTRLQIDQDGNSGKFVYKAVDQDSGEVVKQFPSEDILRFISFYREREGLVVDSLA
jgi:flagellar protein FlaG